MKTIDMTEFQGGGAKYNKSPKRNLTPKRLLNISSGERELKSKSAFTMAEVLITLGIIGIVAAMTLPALIGNYKRKVLETQFKKSVSTISQAIIRTKLELGSDNFVKDCILYNSDDGYYLSGSCYNAFYKSFSGLADKESTFDSTRYEITRFKETIKTYNGKQIAAYSSLQGIGAPVYHTNLMADGTFINMMVVEYYFYIGVDTNGYRGPNQLGHDIFIFTIDQNNDTLSFSSKPEVYTDEELDKEEYEEDKAFWRERKGNPCNFTSNQKANGIGCAWYALRDECPDGSGRGYFECLP